MNFYAHLVAASWHSRDANFALGAMLPDFATMAGLRLASLRLPAGQPASIAEGVRFHQQCDRAFHALGAFHRHQRLTLQHMLSAGLRRGPARGVAHVGVELCLDGALIGAADALYLRALKRAEQQELSWQDPSEAQRFERLMARLREIGVPRGYQDPDLVTQRLLRILGPRPLLTLADNEPALLLDAMPAVHKRVCADAPAIMDALRIAVS